MKVSADGIDLITAFEGCRLTAYRCAAGKLTIGYGHTGPDVKADMVITQDQAIELLNRDLERFENDVMDLVAVPINQGQFDALVSFAFNAGSDIDLDKIAEGLGDSTLLRLLNAGDYSGAADQFLRWNKAGGRILQGLVRRRAAERLLFLGDDSWRAML